MGIDDERRLQAETAKKVYLSVRQEFYVWKQQYATETLSRMVGSGLSSAPVPTAERFPMPHALFEAASLPTLDPNCIEICDYDSDGKIIKQETIPLDLVVVEAAQTFVAYPPYQYCTPTSRSQTARMIDNRSAPFIPFPEDPTFPFEVYLKPFASFQWIEDQRDPDEEVIQYETVRRLHIEHGFSAEIIDDILQCSGFRPLRLSSESGLLWDVSQRDLPPVIWGDGLPSSSKPHLPVNFAQTDLAPTDILGQVNRGLVKFCPNLSCIMHNCHVHVNPDWEILTPPVPQKEPRCTSADLHGQIEAACGPECFLLVAEGDIEEDDNVPNAALEFLTSFLKLEPDLLPCHLAVICRIPCRYAYIHRKLIIEDAEVVSESKTEHRRKMPLQKRHKLDFSGNTPPNAPCVHPGSCSSARVCDCFKVKGHCQRNCRCPDSCVRRWQGCNSTCAGNLRCDNKNRCKCRGAGRECDPEKCTACSARAQSTQCTNVALQRGEFKRFEVKRSRYGLGAFAGEDIEKGDMIGEYVGELLDDAEESLGHRDVVHKHSGLNYCFGMGGTTLDAQWLGNPTRFLNDAKPKMPNCRAEELIVNEEHRITIRTVARVSKGTELTLSYGKGYWGTDNA